MRERLRDDLLLRALEIGVDLFQAQLVFGHSLNVAGGVGVVPGRGLHPLEDNRRRNVDLRGHKAIVL